MTTRERERLRKSIELIALFERVHGRPAETDDELLEWLRSPAGSAALKAKPCQPSG